MEEQFVVAESEWNLPMEWEVDVEIVDHLPEGEEPTTLMIDVTNVVKGDIMQEIAIDIEAQEEGRARGLVLQDADPDRVAIQGADQGIGVPNPVKEDLNLDLVTGDPGVVIPEADLGILIV